ncbi:hypothetical protein WME75_36410 [Sorangium sp. So ce1014]|uniref:hypothetical protein n=1 Tax=Sorangium sp. So ce1014 TaxID=3133326 RepID=UPI003F646350
MSDASTIARMSAAKLRAWLLARMRGWEQDPPVSELHMESPDDYVATLHEQSRDKAFRARLEKAAVATLAEAARGNLREGPDAHAVRCLAELVDTLELRAAESTLREIAERGAFGGHDGALDHDAEELVLFALAGLQTPGELYSKWLALWKRELPGLWPVVTAGLRISDPERALGILPEAVERARRNHDFPLGDVLWAFATDRTYKPGAIAGALAGLSNEARRRCRDALAALGAEKDELDVWLPDHGSEGSRTPAWARRKKGPNLPPRLYDKAAA